MNARGPSDRWQLAGQLAARTRPASYFRDASLRSAILRIRHAYSPAALRPQAPTGSLPCASGCCRRPGSSAGSQAPRLHPHHPRSSLRPRHPRSLRKASSTAWPRPASFPSRLVIAPSWPCDRRRYPIHFHLTATHSHLRPLGSNATWIRLTTTSGSCGNSSPQSARAPTRPAGTSLRHAPRRTSGAPATRPFSSPVMFPFHARPTGIFRPILPLMSPLTCGAFATTSTSPQLADRMKTRTGVQMILPRHFLFLCGREDTAHLEGGSNVARRRQTAAGGTAASPPLLPAVGRPRHAAIWQPSGMFYRVNRVTACHLGKQTASCRVAPPRPRGPFRTI